MGNISYYRCGDYLLPGITLSESPRKLTEPITKYGSMRRPFLREHHPITYNRLLLTERLFPHLREVQQTAHERLDSIMSDILVFNPPPDKAADNLAWAAHMAEIHRIAEKMMLENWCTSNGEFTNRCPAGHRFTVKLDTSTRYGRSSISLAERSERAGPRSVS